MQTVLIFVPISLYQMHRVNVVFRVYGSIFAALLVVYLSKVFMGSLTYTGCWRRACSDWSN